MLVLCAEGFCLVAGELSFLPGVLGMNRLIRSDFVASCSRGFQDAVSPACSTLHLGLWQLKYVCISGWSTFRFFERIGTGDTELMGVVGGEFQAVRVVSPAGKPVARLCWLPALQCLIKCRTCLCPQLLHI